jgi:beta-galactosidase
MYPGINSMKRYAADQSKTRPYIMCEYSHAMGNSNGNFQEYWDIIRSDRKMQGGFIWDWIDQGMKTTTSDGRVFYAYGGDLGGYALQNDENFCANGLIAADRTIHPGLNEVKKGYQNILFKPKDLLKGIITIENSYDFTNLDQYNFKWEQYRDGKKVKEGNFVVELGPHSRKEILLPADAVTTSNDGEYFLNVFGFTKNATELVPANHEVAREQLALSGNYFQPKTVGGQLKVRKENNRLHFTSGNVSGDFDLQGGRFVNYVLGNQTIITPPEPFFWRAPTDNDFGNNMQVNLGIWRTAHVNRIVKKIIASEQSDEGLPIIVQYELTGVGVAYTIDYLIQNDGSIKVTSSMDLTGRDLPELVRFGMRMQLPQQFANLEYYGRGPWENYSDRNTASFVGLYKDDVKNQFTWNYIRPQESGYKTDVRWLALTDNNGVGVRIEGIQPICFSATNTRTEDLDPGLTKKQQHPTDIKPGKEVYLNVDLKQRGVGGDNSWGALPHDQYRLLDKKYSYSYVIRLIDTDATTVNK